MDTSLASRALALLDAALDLPPAERAAWIDAQCAHDTDLAEEVTLLLQAAQSPRGILDRPPAAPEVTRPGRSITHALASRYDVIREIGRGGMATVFLARERKHDREVVVKVLDPTIARLCGAERFQREVHIAATLSHPHIVPLIDSGEVDGYLFYVMPWTAGRSLRAEVEDMPLAPSAAIDILRDVAGALEFAHRAGVVHRDLKPENVLLASGHAFLLDFGIAKLASEASGAPHLTAPGLALGTRRYMAPEQLRGADDVDARADIFAFGVLAAELLSGAPLPDGETGTMARRALQRRAGLPRAMVRVLLDCLATDPAARPTSMAAVLARFPTAGGEQAMRATRRAAWVWRAAAVAVVAAATVVFVRRGAATPAPLTALAEPVAVSVLRNETGDTAMTVVGRFAGDVITEGLQRLGVARVVPWSGALLASEHAAAIGGDVVTTLRDETMAGTVVTGSYYRLRDSLYLQAQLVQAGSGELVSLLAPIVVPASRPEDGVAQLRDRVLGAVAALRDERIASVPGVMRHPPSFTAYSAYDRGLELFLAQQYAPALAEFRAAFARDSTFATAAVWGARAALNLDSMTVASDLATRARATGADLGSFTDASLRYIEARLLGDGTAARSAIAQAAALAPNSRAGYDHAVALLSAGYTRAAREQLLRMDPDRGEMRGWSSYWTQRAHVAYLLGNQVEALGAAFELQRRYPARRVAQVLQARSWAASGAPRQLDSALTTWDSLPTGVYWSQGAALVVASDELLRRGDVIDGRRYGERAVTWLRARLAAAPDDRAHRYWMGSALYDLERYDAARPYFESLAREYPTRLEYRGLAAVLAARRGDGVGASRWLGPAAPHEIPEHMLWCARVAAINVRTEQAITFLTSAADHGLEHYPWLAGSAFRDFTAVVRDPRGQRLLSAR